MNDFRVGSGLYEIACWEIAEMLGVDINKLQYNLEKEWHKVACGRYRSV
jgi:hypothetical protein